MSNNEFDSKWIVKSSGQIHGPYSMEELFEEVQENKFTPIDELRSPETRWVFMRDVPELFEKFKSLKEIEHKRETKTDILKDEETQAPINAQELTPTPVYINKKKEQKKIEESIKVAQSGITKIDPVPKPMATPVLEIKQENKTSMRSKVIGISLVVTMGICISLLFVFKEDLFTNKSDQEAQKNQAQDLENEFKISQKYLESGNFSQALLQLKSLVGVKPVRFIPFLEAMIIEGHLETAKKVIDQNLADKDTEPSARIELYNVASLIAIMESNLKLAEDNINQVLSLDSLNKSAILNRIVISVIKANPKEIMGAVKEAESIQIRNKLTSSAKVQAQVILGAGKDTAVLSAAVEELHQQLQEGNDLKNNFGYQILLAAGFAELKNIVAAAEAVRQSVRRPLIDKDQFVGQDYVSSEIVASSMLNKPCDILLRVISTGSDSALAKVICKYNASEFSEALKMTEEFRKTYPMDIELSAIQSILYLKMNQYEQLNVNLKFNEMANTDTGQYLKYHACSQSQDKVCLQELVKSLENKSKRSTFDYYVLSEDAVTSRNKDNASEYFKRGTEDKPYYRKFLALKSEVGK